jgi:hypothetical protein
LNVGLRELTVTVPVPLPVTLLRGQKGIPIKRLFDGHRTRNEQVIMDCPSTLKLNDPEISTEDLSPDIRPEGVETTLRLFGVCQVVPEGQSQEPDRVRADLLDEGGSVFRDREFLL